MEKDKYIHVGTSGWHYAHWVGPFYPEKLPKQNFLSHYISFFSTVEINNTFYQLPEPGTFQQWQENTPPDFMFAVKASRYITHVKKLKDPKDAVARFLERTNILKDKLGPILFQLPPRWKCNVERLGSFLTLLPLGYKYTFEFRNPTWFNPQVYSLLEDHNAAFCMYDFNRRTSPKKVTADFVYIRLHGPNGPYRGKYTVKALADWARDFSIWLKQEKKIYCYFDNDQKGYAVQNAVELQNIIDSN